VQTQIRPCRGDFFLKINKCAGQIPIYIQENKRAGGFFFSKTINVQTKIRQCRGDFFSKLINVHARLFGTLEYQCKYLFRVLQLLVHFKK
jgi:hypothetical protein